MMVAMLTIASSIVVVRSDTAEAVEYGLRRTAGPVTSAAIVMVAVFSIFATLSMLEFKHSHSSVVMQPGFDDSRYYGINPYALGLWLAVSAALLYLATPAPDAALFATFLAALLTGALLWCLLLSWLAARGGPGAGFFRAINFAAGVTLALVGVTVLWNTFQMAGR